MEDSTSDVVDAADRPARAPPVASRRVRGLCLLALAALCAWLAQTGGLHILGGDPDFEYFYKSGAWLLDHGTLDRGYDLIDGRVYPRGELDWYWPFVPRLMTLLALLPQPAAGMVWLVLNLAALIATLRLVGRHLSGLPPADWPVTQLLPFLLLIAFWVWEFRLNQINSLTLLLMVGSFVCWQRGERVFAGFWLGLAVLLKLTPGLLVLWFALKRQWRTAGIALLTVALAGPVADLATLGWERTAESYERWARKALTAGSHGGVILAQSETDWRNQGLGAVLSRWLHATSYNTRFDNDPRFEEEHGGGEPLYLNVADLPRSAVAALAIAIGFATLVGLIWLARRPASRLSAWQLRFEWAVILLAMLWLMPVLRRYHMIWALPAISMLGAGIHYAGWSSRWSRLALACLGLAVLAQFTMLTMELEASGAILASVAVLALPLIVMLARLGREPRALPGPFHDSSELGGFAKGVAASEKAGGDG